MWSFPDFFNSFCFVLFGGLGFSTFSFFHPLFFFDFVCVCVSVLFLVYWESFFGLGVVFNFSIL